MTLDAHLIDRIYEASVITDRWPDILQDIADRAGARGATIISRSPVGFEMIISPKMRDDGNDFIALGWGSDVDFTAPLFAEQWPGFRAETAYRTPDEIAAMPVHAEFLDPRGYVAGAATVIQGAGDKALHIALEGFPSHAAAELATGFLDTLRPHLARSISLAALRADRSQIVVDSLALAGVPASVIGLGGQLRSANQLFVKLMGNRMIDALGRLRFTDPLLMRQVVQALELHRHQRSSVQSVAVRDEDAGSTFAIHLLPIIGAARDVCGSEGVLMLIANPTNVSIPSPDLLRLLFDLTPAEARIARHLIDGGTVASAALFLRVSYGTVRVHLKAIFARIGVNRQGDLVRLLSAFAPPQA